MPYSLKWETLVIERDPAEVIVAAAILKYILVGDIGD
jgi:hypothetical protein